MNNNLMLYNQYSNVDGEETDANNCSNYCCPPCYVAAVETMIDVGQPFGCPYCKGSFLLKGSLIRHICDKRCLATRDDLECYVCAVSLDDMSLSQMFPKSQKVPYHELYSPLKTSCDPTFRNSLAACRPAILRESSYFRGMITLGNKNNEPNGGGRRYVSGPLTPEYSPPKSNEELEAVPIKERKVLKIVNYVVTMEVGNKKRDPV